MCSPDGGEVFSAQYSIDASSLIDAYHVSYPRDVFPPLWTLFEELGQAGILVASEEVLRELDVGGDELAAWAKCAGLKYPTDDAVQVAVKRILTAHRNLVQVKSLKSQADPFVIAVAEVLQCAVVTCEKGSGNLHGPKIPDVCRARGIRVLNVAQMLRAERIVVLHAERTAL